MSGSLYIDDVIISGSSPVVLILSDSIAKLITLHCPIYRTCLKAFPGITINRLAGKIDSREVSLSKFEYIIVHVGTNDLGSRSDDEIKASYNNLITFLLSKTSAQLFMSAILPRPVDYEDSGRRVININKGLRELCIKRRVSFIHTYRPFIREGLPKRELFAIQDGGLHLNLEGSRILRLFFWAVIQRFNFIK